MIRLIYLLYISILLTGCVDNNIILGTENDPQVEVNQTNEVEATEEEPNEEKLNEEDTDEENVVVLEEEKVPDQREFLKMIQELIFTLDELRKGTTDVEIQVNGIIYHKYDDRYDTIEEFREYFSEVIPIERLDLWLNVHLLTKRIIEKDGVLYPVSYVYEDIDTSQIEIIRFRVSSYILQNDILKYDNSQPFFNKEVFIKLNGVYLGQNNIHFHYYNDHWYPIIIEMPILHSNKVATKYEVDSEITDKEIAQRFVESYSMISSIYNEINYGRTYTINTLRFMAYKVGEDGKAASIDEFYQILTEYVTKVDRDEIMISLLKKNWIVFDDSLYSPEIGQTMYIMHDPIGIIEIFHESDGIKILYVADVDETYSSIRKYSLEYYYLYYEDEKYKSTWLKYFH